jgi:hypothetical protein
VEWTVIEWIQDRYLTWRTGKNKAVREWEAWFDSNVNWRATGIKDMFRKFEHVIVVDPNKFLELDPFAWVPCEDAKQYFWPARALGDNAVWRIERVIRNVNTVQDWTINEIGGTDRVFVATNNSHDALMIAMKWS